MRNYRTHHPWSLFFILGVFVFGASDRFGISENVDVPISKRSRITHDEARKLLFEADEARKTAWGSAINGHKELSIAHALFAKKKSVPLAKKKAKKAISLYQTAIENVRLIVAAFHLLSDQSTQPMLSNYMLVRANQFAAHEKATEVAKRQALLFLQSGPTEEILAEYQKLQLLWLELDNEATKFEKQSEEIERENPDIFGATESKDDHQ